MIRKNHLCNVKFNLMAASPSPSPSSTTTTTTMQVTATMQATIAMRGATTTMDAPTTVHANKTKTQDFFDETDIPSASLLMHKYWDKVLLVLAGLEILTAWNLSDIWNLLTWHQHF
mmetsp:Transcript_71962/g.119210  ORF Transcript_71962/g.119210 Transcript_71962/m.119210 type:complete len:116 (+) Transcript_71962:162-509(+)